MTWCRPVPLLGDASFVRLLFFFIAVAPGRTRDLHVDWLVSAGISIFDSSARFSIHPAIML
jgi:hypothetical protein